GLPAALRIEADARAVGAAALVAAAEGRGRGPGQRHQVAGGDAGGGDLRPRLGDVGRSRVVHGTGQWVLPDLVLGRHFRPEVARLRAHVAVDQLEPGAGERVGKGLRIVAETARDRAVDR